MFSCFDNTVQLCDGKLIKVTQFVNLKLNINQVSISNDKLHERIVYNKEQGPYFFFTHYHGTYFHNCV